MKKVHDIANVAHLWANKLQPEARNSQSNFYFDKETIYSYGRHFPIATHAGAGIVFFTLQSYSNTTAKHIGIVARACGHRQKIYVPDLRNAPAENFASWQRMAENVAANLVNSRKPEKYLSEISAITEQVRVYAEFIGQIIPETLQAILNVANKAEYSAYKESKERFENEEKNRKQKEAEKAHKKALKLWLLGEQRGLHYRDGRDYLRINGDYVETSQGVKLPLDYAKKLQRQIKAGELQQGSKVLQFEVNLITKKEIKIGCHTFPINYLINFKL